MRYKAGHPLRFAFADDRYDDGGFSGGTLERPALQRLLTDIENGRIDCIVVYKIDRLSRALMDFAKLVINKTEAALVRGIFERFLKVDSATLLVKDLNAEGHRTKIGRTLPRRQSLQQGGTL